MKAGLEKELLNMLKENPSQLMMWMMVQFGKLCVDTNAATVDLKQESTFDGQRYEIKARITAKKVRSKKNETPKH